jgi:transposase-like protein
MLYLCIKINDMKKCTKCSIESDATNFRKDKSKVDGLRPICKTCDKSYFKYFGVDNKERLKQYRDSRKELKREYDKQYKIDNKERINERDRLYQQRKRLE